MGVVVRVRAIARIFGSLSHPRSRRALLVSALVVQATFLGLGWLLTFQIVQRSFAKTLEQTIQRQNLEIARRMASVMPESLGEVRYGGTRWEQLQQFVEGRAFAGLPAGGFVCLTDSAGRVLCHPEIRQRPELREMSFAQLTLRPTTRGERSAMPVVRAGTPQRPATGVVRFADGEYHYVATAPLPDSGLRLVVHQPVRELALVGSRETRQVMLIAAVAAVIVLSISALGQVLLLKRYEAAHEALNRQMNENLQLARTIQEGTLPTAMPTVAGYDFAAMTSPADETCGDTYDLLTLPNAAGPDAVAMLLADATGHGIGPALAITQLQAMARVAWRLDQRPAAVARLLDEHLREHAPDGRFVTAWLGVLEPASGCVRMLSAAQDPQMVYRTATGSTERLPTDTVPLGLLCEADAPTQARTLTLEAGDVLLIASDGIVEATNPQGEEFGRQRLARALADHAGGDARGVVGGIMDRLEAFTDGRRQRDDRTLLVLTRAHADAATGISSPA